MEILGIHQIQAWDAFTMEHEPIASIDLMERASRVFISWFLEKVPSGIHRVGVIVSKGNNGGDGLAVARMLADHGLEVSVLICAIQATATADFRINLDRLRHKQLNVSEINANDPIPDWRRFDAIVDGLFGSGLTRPVSGFWKQLIESVNASRVPVYSIDIPSGMFGDQSTPPDAAVIRSTAVLSFERPKLSFFFPSNDAHLSAWEFRSIGLHPDFLKTIQSPYRLIEGHFIAGMLHKRNRHAHKGHFGRALIAAGQKGMMGAAVLAVSAALKSGSGLVYALVPDCGLDILQVSAPEAIVLHGHGKEKLSTVPDLAPYNAVGVGPGIGTSPGVIAFLERMLEAAGIPLVLDADALNVIAGQPDLLHKLPKGSILTPHPGEFERLFGPAGDDPARLSLLMEKAKSLQLYILLKGANTALATPEGTVWFNSTGNPGMAGGGSGDVLTGLITGLLAQGYSPEQACLIGVYVHGLAGDLAATLHGEEAMTARDILQQIGGAFITVKRSTSKVV